MSGVNVVLGAGGPTGLECVKRLLSATNAPVRAVVRDPAKYDATFKAAAADAGEWHVQEVCAGGSCRGSLPVDSELSVQAVY